LNTRQSERMTLAAGNALPSLVKALSQAKIDRYAGVSGDGNPLHTDPQFAAATEFGGTIAHGLLMLAYVSEMMTAAFGARWLGGGRLKVRFRAPARPGDTVTASGQVLRVEDGRTVCRVECRSRSGEVLLDGEAAVESEGR
jgi:3-hydroxybutyryl-CoA dehydratase